MARFWQSRFDHLEDQQQAYQDAKGGGSSSSLRLSR